MSSPIFLDTLFAVALISHRDQYHEQAHKLSELFEGYPLVATDAVLLEVGNSLARGFRQQAAEVIQQLIEAEEVEIIHLTQDLFDRALMLYRSHYDKEWSLVDCVSFAVMREMGITRALTFDHHFAQAGFIPLLRVDDMNGH